MSSPRTSSHWVRPQLSSPRHPPTRENLEGLLATERTDLVAVGRAFIANPDLVQRLQLGAPLNPADETSFYGGTDIGYIDYPAFDELAA